MTDLVVSKLERVAAVSSVANFEAFYADIILLNGTPCPEGGRYPISEHDWKKLLPRAPQITRIIEAARRPATREEIAVHLAMLMANFPNGKANEDSTSIMLEYIHAQQPSIGAMKWAVRHLIRTAKYQPVTAEVLEAIKSGTTEINNAKWHLESRLKEIARCEERERQRKVEEEKQKFLECFYRLEQWHTTGGIDEGEKAKRRAEIAADYDPDIVADAQVRVDAGCWLDRNGNWIANGEPWIDPRC